MSPSRSYPPFWNSLCLRPCIELPATPLRSPQIPSLLALGRSLPIIRLSGSSHHRNRPCRASGICHSSLLTLSQTRTMAWRSHHCFRRYLPISFEGSSRWKTCSCLRVDDWCFGHSRAHLHVHHRGKDRGELGKSVRGIPAFKIRYTRRWSLHLSVPFLLFLDTTLY